jgi:hypothetical protein
MIVRNSLLCIATGSPVSAQTGQCFETPGRLVTIVRPKHLFSFCSVNSLSSELQFFSENYNPRVDVSKVPIHLVRGTKFDVGRPIAMRRLMYAHV